MKKLPILLLILLSASNTGVCQEKKFKLFKKSDIAPMVLSFSAGHIKGWRDQFVYHPNQFFNQFPNLNRPFWDIREQDEPSFMNMEVDADHVFASAYKGFLIAGIAIKIGEKQKWYLYIWDGVKYAFSHSVGFASSYYLIHKNKL